MSYRRLEPRSLPFAADDLAFLRSALAGRYGIECELGRGASAAVYSAVDQKHRRRVALKVLHAAVGSAVDHRRFLAEIEIAARLQHPHILPLFDSGEAGEPRGSAGGGRLFYVMPLVDGGSLRDLLRRRVQLPIEDALRITRQVAAALDHAHAERVLHRDIKPENIMLSEAGDRLHAMVADFGIACAFDEPGSGSLTETGIAIGTPAYMSPEQGSGERTLDARSDVYSLACVLYEMLAGEPPFTGPNARSIMARRLREAAPSVREARDTVPAAVDRALRRALARVPADRYAAAGEFAAALRGEAPVRVVTFGGLTVRAGDRPLEGPGVHAHGLALLALLARAGTRGVTRERALSLLWPGAGPAAAREQLDRTVGELRRELGVPDGLVLAGPHDLQLDPDAASADAAEFAEALADGDAARAVLLYAGPFADGLRLDGAPAFERWVERERATLQHEYHLTLEGLARAAEQRGDHAAAAAWWRRLAAQDPLNARLALALMAALVRAGDRSAAIQHALLYEALIEQQVELPLDREVVALADRLRAESAPPAAPAPAPAAPPAPAPARPAAVAAPSAAPARLARRTGRLLLLRRLTVGGLLVAGGAGTALWRARDGRADAGLHYAVGGPREPAPLSGRREPVIAVGRIVDYRANPEGAELARPLADMLATNLARVPGLRVVSTARMYELLRQTGGDRDSAAGALPEAARHAGASALVDGAIYALRGGRLRLDLRLMELESGDVRQALSVSGGDAFALVDSGTAQLAARLGERVGGKAPSGIADVTTRSIAAYRLYEEGLRARSAGRNEAAASLFEAALREDSTFALAAYYGAVTAPTWAERWPRFARAVRLAERTTDRERLIIRVGWANGTFSPSLRAVAETLAIRYPDEVEGPLYAGIAATVEGRFPAAIPYFRRVVAMDSSGLRGEGARCAACEALEQTVAAYQQMDSLAAAEREARSWIRLQPKSARAWIWLVSVLDLQGRHEEALGAYRTFATLAPEYDGGLLFLATHRIAEGSYGEAERILREVAHIGTAAQKG
ncbi:MAG TPA: protein kinase, partial [Gemmatimonadaceae bacterium]|nr:protein kinase [Gemmatimonadaceae bacterium]